mgnify:FL=1
MTEAGNTIKLAFANGTVVVIEAEDVEDAEAMAVVKTQILGVLAKTGLDTSVTVTVTNADSGESVTGIVEFVDNQE